MTYYELIYKTATDVATEMGIRPTAIAIEDEAFLFWDDFYDRIAGEVRDRICSKSESEARGRFEADPDFPRYAETHRETVDYGDWMLTEWGFLGYMELDAYLDAMEDLAE